MLLYKWPLRPATLLLVRSQPNLLLRTSSGRSRRQAKPRLPNPNHCQLFPKSRPPLPRVPANSPRICHNGAAPSGNIGTKNEVSHPAHQRQNPPIHRPPNHLRPRRVKRPTSNIHFPPPPHALMHTPHKSTAAKNFPPPPSAFPSPPYLRLITYALRLPHHRNES